MYAYTCRDRAMKHQLARRVVSEAVGTAMLLAAVVGSGIMGERLSGGNIALALLANTIATGAAPFVIAMTGNADGATYVGPISSHTVVCDFNGIVRGLPVYSTYDER